MKSKMQKQEEAKLRAKQSSELSLSQRIEKLNKKFGAGNGAVKERRKLTEKFIKS